MAATRVLGVVPARLGSERIPRKPLQDLAGRPLIEWVWRRAASFGFLDGLVVATDSEEVAAACNLAGAAVEMTSAEHASGTERVAEVLSRPDYGSYDVVLNIQGDEPFMPEETARRATDLVRDGWAVGTAAVPIGSREELHDPAVVKVVRGGDGRALYFSRAAIPHWRGEEGSEGILASPGYLRHVGVYAYTPEALRRWSQLPPDPLESAERLEQLRPLAAGIPIGVAVVEEAPPGIDTPEDLEHAQRRLLELDPYPDQEDATRHE